MFLTLMICFNAAIDVSSLKSFNATARTSRISGSKEYQVINCQVNKNELKTALLSKSH